MSMWEIEALIEDSIRIVAQTDKNPTEKRTLYHSLYTIQGQFDCSFTHFRVMPLLLEAGYARTMELTEYPSYQAHKAFFEHLKTQRFSFIYKNVEEEWSRDNPVCAYWDKNSEKIYYDPDSALWEPLTGTPPPEMVPTIEVAQTLVSLAQAANDKATVYHWMAFALIGQIMTPTQASLEVLKQQFQPLKTSFSTYDFEGFKPMHRSFDLKELKAGIEEGYFDEKTSNLIQWMVQS